MANLKKKVLSVVVSLLMFGAATGTTCVVSQPITASARTIWKGYNSPTLITTKSGLYLRKGGGTKYDLVIEDAIPCGTWVTTKKISDNGWAYVKYKIGKEKYYGWIFYNNGKYAEIYTDFD
jgi:uncharacterized protein YgiM (DUF1202 family)